MADLSDEELEHLRLCIIDARTRDRMIAEIQRRRTEQAAGREHVERVVMEFIDGPDGAARSSAWCRAIAGHIAGRLSALVLSANDIEMLASLRRGLPKEGHPVLALLDRLIAGAESATALTEDERRAAAGWRAVNAPWGNPRDVVERNHNAVVAIVDRLIAGAKP